MQAGEPGRIQILMGRLTAFLVEKRKLLLCMFLILAAVSLLLIGHISINYDLTKYLPADSNMKQGIKLMEQEFGPGVTSNLRVMLSGLSEEEKKSTYDWLSGLDQASEVSWEPGDDYNRDGYTLYEITTGYDSHSKEAAALFNAVRDKFGSKVATDGTIHEANVPLLPLYIIIVAVGLVSFILLVMCNSWFEPVIIMLNIGISVAINFGTQVLFSSISEYTFSILGIMQLVLPMDYSIILLNRYTQAKEISKDNVSAMKSAIRSAFPAIAGSSLTTFAGLICLAFMSFKLGTDMGFALAKGVIMSLICIFTVLPSLILMSDKWIVKTRKKALSIPMARCSHTEFRLRIVILVLFPILFIGSFFLKNNTEILYMLQSDSRIEPVFEKRNSLVLLYETKDSERIADLMTPLEQDEQIMNIAGYYNTLGRSYRAEEIAELFAGENMPDASLIRLIYTDRFASASSDEKMPILTLLLRSQTGYNKDWAMTPAELVSYLQDQILDDPRFSAYISDGIREQISQAGDLLRENALLLEGEHYGRVVMTSIYPEDSAETRTFINSLSERCQSQLEGKTWLIGTSVMNEEMAQTFDSELNRITLISALAIFLVVALTFRSLIIPLVLVLTVQCGIYLTMAMIGLCGGGMYYLALLMVQCILMGATIDYAILYTSYYREKRKNADCALAIKNAYDGALHTILTSALIMIAAAGILGFVFANPAIGEICLTISRGAISATILIVFVLPGVLAALDRFVIPRKNNGKERSSQ